MSHPEYRQATTDDADAITSIINAVVEEPNPVGFDGPTTPENVRTWLTRQGEAGAIFLCHLDEEAVGFSALDFDTQEPDISVLGVWLLPKHRRKGLGTPLAGFLRAAGVDTVVVTGATACACVRSSIEDALAEGFRPIAVRECIGDRIPGAVEWSLFDVDAKFGDVEPLETVMEYLRRNDIG